MLNAYRIETWKDFSESFFKWLDALENIKVSDIGIHEDIGWNTDIEEEPEARSPDVRLPK